MIYDEILKFFGQQNFALVNTNAANVTVLRNTDGRGQIFCALIDNERQMTWGPSQILALNEKLKIFGGGYNDVLFIVVTGDADRDKSLAQLTGVRLWLADGYYRRLYVYENQPEDFYGLRLGIEETIAGELYPERGEIRPAAGRKKRGVPYKIRTAPYVTIALILVNVAYFTLIATRGSLSDTGYMLKMGANYGVYVFERGQVWRIVTSMFIHFSFSHLAGNMFYLGIAGYNLEKTAGHLKFFLIYMLSGIGAGVISAGYYYLTSANTISAGASGAVYGLIGAMLFVTFKNRGRLRSPQMFLRIGIIIVFLYYSNFAETSVDGAAHIAGFVLGLLLSWIFLGTGKGSAGRRRSA